MRTRKEIDTEIKKLRLVIRTGFNEASKDNAWSMLLALQWCKSTNKTLSLSLMELSGITMDQANAIHKMAKRETLPKFSIRTSK